MTHYLTYTRQAFLHVRPLRGRRMTRGDDQYAYDIRRVEGATSRPPIGIRPVLHWKRFQATKRLRVVARIQATDPTMLIGNHCTRLGETNFARRPNGIGRLFSGQYRVGN